MKKTYILPTALVALLAAGCSLLPQEAAPPVVEVQAPQVTQREVTAVKRGSIESRQSVNVTFAAPKQSSLYFRSSGRLKKVYATPGAKVTAGTLLAELEPGSLPYDIQSAEIDLEKLKLTYERSRSRIGFVDGPSETDLKRSELDLKSAELKLQRLRDNLADLRLVAPFDGQVVSVAAAEGDNVNSYGEVVVLGSEGGALAKATIDDTTAVKLQPGQVVDIFPNDGDPTAVKGKVVTVPQVGSKDKTLVITPDKASDRLRVGRNGRAEVILQAKSNVLLVPLSSIRTFGGRKFVTLVTGQTRQEVEIKTGLESDQYAEVLEGLKEGDQVVSR